MGINGRDIEEDIRNEILGIVSKEVFGIGEEEVVEDLEEEMPGLEPVAMEGVEQEMPQMSFFRHFPSLESASAAGFRDIWLDSALNMMASNLVQQLQ